MPYRHLEHGEIRKVMLENQSEATVEQVTAGHPQYQVTQPTAWGSQCTEPSLYHNKCNNR